MVVCACAGPAAIAEAAMIAAVAASPLDRCLIPCLKPYPVTQATAPAYRFRFFLTFQSSLAGEPSRLPAASRARTAKECLPFFTLTVSGERHETKGLPSSEHSKLTLGSEEENSNVAFLFRVLSLGPLVIWVSGVTQSATASWLSSPKPSWWQSGSSVAET